MTRRRLAVHLAAVVARSVEPVHTQLARASAQAQANKTSDVLAHQQRVMIVLLTPGSASVTSPLGGAGLP